MNALEIQKRLGEVIRDERNKLGISQEELAFRCKLHRTYIGSVERGERNVSIVNIVKIAEILRVSLSILFAKANL